MTNADYTASTSRILRPNYGSISYLVHRRTRISGQLVMVGQPLECSGSFRPSAIPMSAVVSSPNNRTLLAGSKRLWRPHGATRYMPFYSITPLHHPIANVCPQTSAGALHNVINDTSTFVDASSTALIASVTFRLAVLNGDNSTYISNATAAYNFVQSNIDSNGWLRNTVNPLNFYTPSASNETSPEGQSFVLLLEAARRDFQNWVGSEATLPSGGGMQVVLSGS